MENLSELQQHIKENIDKIVLDINEALNGNNIEQLSHILERLGRGNVLPHWYHKLVSDSVLPNLDGKTIGSVVEMLLVAVLEHTTLRKFNIPPLKVNPAKGVDLPDLALGIKSPSENYCTSEPFFSAYERLIGNEHDAIILLTDYQTAKKNPPLQLQIIKWSYLTGSEIADKNLCNTARVVRQNLLEENEIWVKKVFKFLAYINQSDWRAKKILELVNNMNDENEVIKIAKKSLVDFEKINKKNVHLEKELLPDTDYKAIERIISAKPIKLGIVDAADNWVGETQKDFGRLPNDNEWSRLLNGPLNGKIGMSFALQWRYNFGALFRNKDWKK